MSSQKRTVYFIRHGQAEHNVSKNYSIHDPKLTDLGISQARSITLPKEPTKIFVSPLRRTIQTALHGFDETHHHKFHLLPLLQERNAGELACDTGSHKSILSQEFPQLSTHIQTLDDDWFKPNMKAVDRIAALKQFLSKHIDENNNEVIVLVSHFGVYELWTGKPIKNGEIVEIELQ